MSFILDALRKSEHERQRQTGPGVADLRVSAGRDRGFPVWAIAIAALLAVNLIVVLVLFLRSSGKDDATASAPPPAPAQTQVPAQTQAPTQSASADSTASLQVPPPANLSPMHPLTEARPLPAPPVSTQQPLSELEPIEDLHPAVQPEPQLRPAPARPPVPNEALPTMAEASLKGAPVPSTELHLDIHVYADVPAQRFVSVNGRKYREGEKTQEGAQVERITPDGVIFNYQGTRFLLPRE